MGRTKGRSPARGGGQLKGQRSLDDYATPRRSARLQSVDQKQENSKIEAITADLVIEPRDAQTIALQISSGQEAKKVSKQDKKQVEPQKRKATNKGQALKKLKLTEDEQRDLLKNFDLSHVYGPCRGISRRDRFLRAHRFNLQPLPEDMIIQILEQHKEDSPFQKCIWDQNELLRLHV